MLKGLCFFRLFSHRGGKTLPALLLFAVLAGGCGEKEMIVQSRVSETDSHSGPVLDIIYNSEGGEIISGGFDSNLMIWKGVKATLKNIIRGDYDKIFDIAWIDSTTVVTANYGGYITFWDISKRKRGVKKKVHKDFVTSVSYDKSRGLLVSAGWDGSIKISRLEPFEVVATCMESPIPVIAVETDAETGRFYAAFQNGRVAAWDINDCQTTLKSGRSHETLINSMAIHPNKTHLVTLGEDHRIEIFDLQAWGKGDTLEGHRAPVISAAFSPDGRILATGGRDNLIILWDFETGKKLYSIAAHNGEVSALAFHPSGEYLASASFDRLVKVWHIAEAKEKE